MSHFYPDVHFDRIKEAHKRIKREDLYGERVKLDLEVAVTPEPVPYAKRLELEYKPIKQGEVWGKKFDCAWFHMTGEVPASWKGKTVALQIETNGESLLFDETGCPIYAFTDAATFDTDYRKDRMILIDECQGGEKIDYWLDAAANSLFGIARQANPHREECAPEDLHGKHTSSVIRMDIAQFDKVVHELFVDLEIIIDLVGALPAENPRKLQVIRIASRALDLLPQERGGPAAVREALKPIFELGADPATLDVTAIGHAHIDTAWLWPVRETIRKTGRTFASQIHNIEKYPGFKFGASQPQLYAFTKEHYPALYEKIKKAVANGDWELQGGMWVEADCNIPNGESLVRQMLVGKHFYMDEFGQDVKNLWIPDVFGYSGNLPQIMKKAGVDYFLTQKLSWNRYNRFPHNSFMWRGIDGSEVFTHFPPEDNYNSPMLPSQLKKHEKNNQEAGLINEAICLYGIGDGGGGPSYTYIDRVSRVENLNGCPRVHFGFAQTTLEKLASYKDELDTWEGELYFEFHRGTFTTQADVKLWNRRCEEALRLAEMMASIGGIANYPAEQFRALWKRFLINHFHDIIPGSSIHRVYAEAIPEMKKIVAECYDIANAVAKRLFKENKEAATLFNPSATDFTGMVTLPDEFTSAAVNGEALVVQCEAGECLAKVTVPAQSFVVLELGKAAPAMVETMPIDSDVTILENDLVSYRFNKKLQLISAYDKELKREFIAPNACGNKLSLYDDHPHTYDAWDIDEYAVRMPTHEPEIESLEKMTGPARTGIMAMMKLGDASSFVQHIWLEKDSKRLDFVTDVNWNENHKLARVEFPVAVHAPEARYEVQYGTIGRATHNNTKWQYAQFECLGHRFVDYSDLDAGVALLTDSKYGYCVKNDVMSISLLRSPTEPDPIADRGMHHFVYSFLPHAGNLTMAECPVIAQAAIINQGVAMLEGVEGKAVLPVKVEGRFVDLSVVKKAEKENCFVIRIAETSGHNAVAKLSSDVYPNARFVECDICEWKAYSSELVNGAEVALKPFEFKTFKVYV